MIHGGWALGRAAMQARLLPERSVGRRDVTLPGDWAANYHEASSLRRSELARTPEQPGPSARLRRDRLEAILSAAGTGAETAVVVDAVEGVAAGAYVMAAGHLEARGGSAIDPVAFWADVLGGAGRPPPVQLAVVDALPHTDTAHVLRTYRYGLIVTGRRTLALEHTATRFDCDVRSRFDFADRAANRHLGLVGTERACLGVLLLTRRR